MIYANTILLFTQSIVDSGLVRTNQNFYFLPSLNSFFVSVSPYRFKSLTKRLVNCLRFGFVIRFYHKLITQLRTMIHMTVHSNEKFKIKLDCVKWYLNNGN